MPKCDFRGVIENSPFVERSLKSMYPGTDEAELPARLEALAQMSPSAEEIRSEIPLLFSCISARNHCFSF